MGSNTMIFAVLEARRDLYVALTLCYKLVSFFTLISLIKTDINTCQCTCIHAHLVPFNTSSCLQQNKLSEVLRVT